MTGETKVSSITLGDMVKDTVSGFYGIAVARHTYLNGCARITVQPCIDKDGKLPDAPTFDEPQLVILPEKGVEQGDHSTGGPEKYSDVRKY